VNWLVFDAGFHSAHHENPGAHWSELRQLHAVRAAEIEPRLNQDTILSYCLRHYVLGRLFPRFRVPGVASAAG
jgi:fatty acid desaturase